MTDRFVVRLLGAVSLGAAGAMLWLFETEAAQSGITTRTVVTAITAGVAVLFGAVTLTGPLWLQRRRTCRPMKRVTTPTLLGVLGVLLLLASTLALALVPHAADGYRYAFLSCGVLTAAAACYVMRIWKARE